MKLNKIKIANGSKIISGLKYGILALSACMVVWCFAVATRGERIPIWQPAALEASWVQLVEGEAYALAELAEVQPVAVGEPLVIEATLPTFYQEKVILFYSKDVEVAAYLNDTLVYTFVMQDALSFLQTPGNHWNSITVSPADSGAVLRLVLTTPFENRYATTLKNLYLVCPVETVSAVLYCDGFRMVMSLVVFVMALICYINTILWERKALKQYFFALGNLYFSVSLWLFAMYGLFDWFFQRPIVSYLISMLMANAIPLAVYEFTRTILAKPSKLLSLMGCLVWGGFALTFVLQFVCGISLLTLLPVTYFVFSVGSLGCMALIVHHIATCKHWQALNFHFVSLLIIFLGAIAEIVVLCVLPARTDLIGVAAICGLFVYLLVNQIHITKAESNVDIEKILLEQNYQKLQNTTLMQQIKAHFFYNTLNSISALCKQDAEQADRAVLLFAKYMRSYMHLINKHENIPLSQELALVQCTLDIEQIRFPNRFSYELDLQETNFETPPLCLQPLIENAIGHGLRKVTQGGKIVVRSWRQGDTLCISVQDNGAGFDVAQLANMQSVGLKNLQSRIALMARGNIEIVSEQQKGTVVTLTFPMEQVRNHSELI